jgi:hypothetical protein
MPEYGYIFLDIFLLFRRNPHWGDWKTTEWTRESVVVARQRCADLSERAVAAAVGERGGVPLLEVRGALASVTQICAQVPLPETPNEVCEVARYLGSKRLSETGELSRYRVIHFATHGALAGQIRGNTEPGLLLTPPDEATEIDDGYLTASEIAGPKLGADWVILSACPAMPKRLLGHLRPGDSRDESAAAPKATERFLGVKHPPPERMQGSALSSHAVRAVK